MLYKLELLIWKENPRRPLWKNSVPPLEEEQADRDQSEGSMMALAQSHKEKQCHALVDSFPSVYTEIPVSTV